MERKETFAEMISEVASVLEVPEKSIKKELESGASVKFIAIKYKVSSNTITRSINRK